LLLPLFSNVILFVILLYIMELFRQFSNVILFVILLYIMELFRQFSNVILFVILLYIICLPDENDRIFIMISMNDKWSTSSVK
jgi:hypothetical protein